MPWTSTHPEPRLWARVRQVNGCWEVARGLQPNGYSQVWAYGKTRLGHIVMYEAARGPIPMGLHIDHLCRNRACVNPDHMEAVTPRVNILRGEGLAAKNAVKTHCLNGHEFNEKNMWRSANGRERACLVCINDRKRAYRRARKSVAA